MSEWLVGILFGVVVVGVALAQWYGLEGRDHHPGFVLGRMYLLLPAGVGIVIVSSISLADEVFGRIESPVATALTAISLLAIVASLIAWFVMPYWRVRPEWQREQMRWLDDHMVDGRWPWWADRPDGWKYRGVIVRRTRRWWGFDDPGRVSLDGLGEALRDGDPELPAGGSPPETDGPDPDVGRTP